MSAQRQKKKYRRDGILRDSPPATRRRLPLWKKILYSVITLMLFFGCIEILLAVCGIDPILYTEDPYVGFSSVVPLFTTDPQDDSRMRTANNKRKFFNHQQFAKEKPANTYRIFCLGGSTTYGRPYDDATSFCGWLRAFLAEVDSDHQWDVVNAGGISYASYRVALLMEELIQYEPDLFIVYTGHNEFLEERTYRDVIQTPAVVRSLGAIAGETRLFAALSKLGDTIRSSPDEKRPKPTSLTDDVVTKLDGDVIGPTDYTRDDKAQQQILDHYRFNLVRIVDIARFSGAKVIFVSPASNLKDCAPFKSEHSQNITAADRRRAETHLREGASLLAEHQYAKASDRFRQGLNISPRHANLHYQHGRALLALRKTDLAIAAFEHARDEDICPLRALGPINQSVADVANQTGVPLVDFDAVVRKQSEHFIPGENLFLDHVHPTIQGHRLLALEIIDAMRHDKIIASDAKLSPETIGRVTKRVEGAIDQQAHTAALRNLSKVLQWAGKLEEAERLGLRAGLQGDPEAFFQAGIAAQKQGRLDDAIAYYRGALKLQEDVPAIHNALGGMLEATGQVPEAITHYRRAIVLAKRRIRQTNDDDKKANQRRKLAQAHTQLGSVLSQDPRTINEAFEHLHNAIKADSNYPHAHDRLALALFKRGQYEKALESVRKATRLAPRDDQIQTHFITMLIAMDRLDDADSALRLTMKRKPLSGKLLQWSENLGRAFATHPNAELRDDRRALFWAKHVAEATQFKVPEVLDTLAAAYAESNQFAKAIETAQKAIKLADDVKQDRLATEIRERLKLYEQGKPARIPRMQPNQ